MSKIVDMTGKDIGYWHVLKRSDKAPKGRAYWDCQCSLCGKIKSVSGANLRQGQSFSCGCTTIEKMRQASIKHEENKQYGFLKVIRMATEEEKPRNNRTGIYWNCTCTNCGRKNVIVFGDYLRNGDTTSCGCITSKNESKIAKMLDNLNISYIPQYRFHDLSSTGRACDELPFDFAVFNNNNLLYLIEYDGEQHFLQAHAWTKEAFKKTQQNDMLKNNYCFQHNIPLIRIKYNVNYNNADLRIETTRFLLTKDNINEYYKLEE